MATTTYFEKNIVDPDNKSLRTNLQFALTSFLGPHTLLIKVDDRSILLNEEDTKEFFAAIESAGRYLNLL